MTAPTRRRWTLKGLLLAFAGVLLLQTAWAMVVPPFRGADEHDHAYRAASVARGDWAVDHASSPIGRGEILDVPRDIVVAASPVCSELSYSDRYDCQPQPSDRPGLVSVASSASRYNPLFYLVVGTSARPFHGVAALYAMRATAGLLCAVMLALVLMVVTTWSRSVFMPIAVGLAVTPVMLYSTMVAAPNGLEMAGSMLVWTSLLGVGRVPADDPRARTYLALAAVGAVPVGLLRFLGPLWLVLIVATCLVLLPPAQRRSLIRLGRARVSAGVAAVSCVAGLAWTIAARTDQVPGSTGGSYSGFWTQLPSLLTVWVLQSIAAFPLRDDPAPAALYAIAILALGALLVAALRTSARRERLVLGLIALVATALPVLITEHTFREAGPMWQGRYGLPYSMGFILLCGLVVDRRGASTRPRVQAACAGATALAVIGTELIGQLHVLSAERSHSPLAGTAAWHAPSPLLVIVLVISGTLLCAASIGRRQAVEPAIHRSSVLRAEPESMASAARPIPTVSASSTGSSVAS